MALSVAVTNHVTPVIAQSQPYVVGFLPKALLGFFQYATATGNAIRSSWGFAAAAGSGDQRVVYAYAEDANTPTLGIALEEDTPFYRIYNFSGAPNLEESAPLTSFDSGGGGGFTLNHQTLTTGARPFSTLALGGADLTNVKTGKFTLNQSTGAQSVTGVEFQPDCVIFFASAAAAADTLGATQSNSTAMMGWATGSSAQGVAATRVKDSANPSVSRRMQLTNRCIKFLTDAGGQGEAHLTQFTSDGFDLNVDEAAVGAYRVYYIALKGGSYAAGAFNGRTTNGSQTVSGFGSFTPKVVLFLSANQATSSANNAHARRSLGVDANGTRWGGWFGDQDAVNPSNNSHRTVTTKSITMATEGNPTVNAEASITGFGSGSFDLDWTTTNGVANEVMFLAIGDAAAGPPPSEGLAGSSHIIRLPRRKWSF